MAVGAGSCACGDKNCACDDKKCSCGEMIVKKGQKVLYKKWAGNEVKVDNREEWLLVEQKDIMAIVE
jgi:co-chaperonin GroES (HSP10)